jgi:hypothetical protein
MRLNIPIFTIILELITLNILQRFNYKNNILIVIYQYNLFINFKNSNILYSNRIINKI